MNLKPLSNRVLIEPVPVTETDSGFVIPEQEWQAPRGRVVGLGSGRLPNGKEWPFVVKLGDLVLHKHAVEEIEFQGKKLVLCREQDIHCILEGK